MKQKFKIMYPSDHPVVEKRSQPYKPPNGKMVVMNGSGVFFLYDNEAYYYPSIQKLSNTLPKYDVIWKQ